MKKVVTLLYSSLISLFLSGCEPSVLLAKNSAHFEKETNIEAEHLPDNLRKKSTSTEPINDKKIEEELTHLTSEAEGIIPVRIEIPKINVNAPIEQVGLLKTGQMDVPKKDSDVGWFEPGKRPGTNGNAVFAGHVDNKTGPAVFFYLKNLDAGDEINVFDEKGKKLTFTVYKKESYPYDDAPIEMIFGNTLEKNLNLITCTGKFDKKTGNHENRLVVFARLKTNS